MNKLNNAEVHKILEIRNLSRLNFEKLENLDRLIGDKKNELVIKNFPTRTTTRWPHCLILANI